MMHCIQQTALAAEDQTPDMVAVMQLEMSYADRQSRLRCCKGLPVADMCPKMAGKGHAHAVAYSPCMQLHMIQHGLPTTPCLQTCVLSMHKNRKGLCPRSGRSGQTQCTTTQTIYVVCIVGLGKLMQISLHTPVLTAAAVGFTSLPWPTAAAAAAALLTTPDPAGRSQLC
jgi:hypothetical protein